MDKKYTSTSDDLQLVALLVAKQLRSSGLSGFAPGMGDYRLVDSKRHPTAKTELHFNVNLGRGAATTVFDFWWKDEAYSLDSLVSLAKGIAEKIAEIGGQAATLCAMLSEVRCAAKREVAKARRRGLPHELTSVELTPVEAGSRFEPMARVELLALGHSLRPEPFAFHAEYAKDVVEAFAGKAEEQANRAACRAGLDRIGATGTIDAVVVTAIEAAGLDVPTVLAKLRDTDDWIVDLPRPGGGVFRLHWDNGAVHAQVQLADGVSWHEGKLHFAKAPRAMSGLAKGIPLAKVFDHPFFNDRHQVCWGFGAKDEHATVYCSDNMLNFDADSGRLWAA